MRELSLSEMNIVSGAGDDCSGNEFGGISEPKSLGEDLIAAYEGIVAATSHVFERVAKAF